MSKEEWDKCTDIDALIKYAKPSVRKIRLFAYNIAKDYYYDDIVIKQSLDKVSSYLGFDKNKTTRKELFALKSNLLTPSIIVRLIDVVLASSHIRHKLDGVIAMAKENKAKVFKHIVRYK